MMLQNGCQDLTLPCNILHRALGAFRMPSSASNKQQRSHCTCAAQTASCIAAGWHQVDPAALQMSEAARRQSLINLRKSGGIASKIGLWEKKVPEPGAICSTSAAAVAWSMMDCCCEHGCCKA